MSMDTETLNKGFETMANISRLAANISTPKAAPQPEKKEDNMNQPHSQTVEVKVGDPENLRKPMILKEKNETHIHKVFPDNRELSEKECEIEKIRLTNEHELKMRELEFRIQQENEARDERKEREEYARQERKRREERERKINKRLAIGFCVAGAVGLGVVAYGLYTDTRRAKNNRVALGEPQAVQLTPGEGTVS